MPSIQIDSASEQRLAILAQRTGRSPRELIEEGIEGLEQRYAVDRPQVSPQHIKGRGDRQKDSGEARAAVWRESVKNLPRTPPLSDEAVSRESMYDGQMSDFSS
jgi:predicted DNA-binding protein